MSGAMRASSNLQAILRKRMPRETGLEGIKSRLILNSFENQNNTRTIRMASSWIVKRGDKEGGPFTSPQLRSLAKSGQLRRTDLVTREGSQRFVKAEEIKGLNFPPRAQVLHEEAEYGLVEIIDDEEPVIVIEAVDEPKVVDYDYDYNVEDGEDEPPPPPRSRGSRNRVIAAPVGRSSGSRRSARREKPEKQRKPAKKTSGEEEDEDGPWANLAYGLACLAGGVILFIVMSNEDPNTWETGRRGGFLIVILKLIYNIGGRWTVLGLLVLCSGLFFWPAANQFRKR